MLAAFLHMHDTGGGWWGLMMVGWIVFWGIVIWALVTVLRRGDTREPSAQEVLDRRLADGEISVEEYERMRTAMRPPRGGVPSHS